MNLHYGVREADIARRENGIVSWLGFRDHMPAKELFDLFDEGMAEQYARQARMVTRLALDNLVIRETVQQGISEVQGTTFSSVSLIEQSIADSINPDTVELTPREMVIMGFLGTRSEAQTATELDTRLGLDQEAGRDAWRTEACLGHLAKLELIEAVQDLPGAYRLL